MQLHAIKQLSLEQPASLPDPHNFETGSSASGVTSSPYSTTAGVEVLARLTQFQSQFTGCMMLHADAQTVARYLDAHQGWFCRCAHPMKVEFLGNNGYDLTVGRFGAFGYQVEPKIGLELLPQDQGAYRVRTIPLTHPETHQEGPESYKVDFQSVLHLVEALGESQASTPISDLKLTQVEWHLELTVVIQFPKFIHRLPQRLVQSTGDRLLTQIVRQVSHRLTAKVQEDFHTSLGLSLSQPCLNQS